jgi:hypothetical protein
MMSMLMMLHCNTPQATAIVSHINPITLGGHIIPAVAEGVEEGTHEEEGKWKAEKNASILVVRK